MHPTLPLLSATDFPRIRRTRLEILQVNLGYKCNQSCLHCHVNAGPNRIEMMGSETAALVVEVLRRRRFTTLDLTGGAPELNAHFRSMVREARALGVKVIDRCNLTILSAPGQEDLAAFLAEQGVEVVASLPCYSPANVDRQRGNGAGKSTLLRVLAGFVSPAHGEVQVLGRRFGPDAGQNLSGAQWRELRAEIGQVMQGLHLVPRLSARENVLIGALSSMHKSPAWRSWTRLYTAELRAEADAALAKLGLAGLADVRADKLSGGERQKVGIARMMLQRARLILVDEPTAALDPTATHHACQALLQAAEGGTLIVVSHHRELLPLLAARVIGIVSGRVAFDLPSGQIDEGRLNGLYEHASVAMEATGNPGPDSRAPSVVAHPAVAG